MRVNRLTGVCVIIILLGAGCKEKPEAVTVEEPKKTPTSETEYFAVFMEGKKVGYAIQSRRQSDGKVTTTEEVSITMNRAGVPITINTAETSIETAEGKPLGFEATQKLGAMEMKVVGTVDEDGMVKITTSSMGGEASDALVWPQGAMMAEGLRLLAEEKGLKAGVEYDAKIFSAAMMQAVDAHIRVGGKEEVDLLGRVVPLTEVVTTMNMPGAGEITSTSYVDDQLRVQKNLVPIAGMQIEMVACAKEFALGKNDVFEVINKLFLASPVPLDNPDGAAAITYTLSPLEGAELNIPSTDNQQVHTGPDGKVTVTVRPVAASSGQQFPYAGNDEAVAAATKPNRFLQSEDEQIVRLARKAIGGTKDAAEAVKRIEQFVAEYIDNKDLSIGYASAAEVAASRQGDCSEHAVLTAAMCRAVGIPARVVTGVAYVDDWSGLQGFGGHAWVEAYVGRRTGRWVGLDATFKGTGRGGYGPGHIALAIGDGEPADFFNLAATLGKFKIDKVEVDRR